MAPRCRGEFLLPTVVRHVGLGQPLKIGIDVCASGPSLGIHRLCRVWFCLPGIASSCFFPSASSLLPIQTDTYWIKLRAESIHHPSLFIYGRALVFGLNPQPPLHFTTTVSNLGCPTVHQGN
ncbi:hypothetical protein NXS19_005460 [Fusarium pseudograminearum]|nr:hypothetical protein NXS19_005460 [Fusarium pseudograminearum]